MARMEAKRNAWGLVGNVEGKSFLGIPMRQRQEFNGSKGNVMKKSGMHSSGSGLGPFIGCYNSVLNGMIPYHATKFLNNSGIYTSNKNWNLWQIIISSHAVALGCCPQGVSQVKGIQFQHANLSMHCSLGNGENIKMPKYI